MMGVFLMVIGGLFVLLSFRNDFVFGDSSDALIGMVLLWFGPDFDTDSMTVHADISG